MRAVLTRVNSASVAIDGQVVGKIGKGFLILLGVGPDDTEKECRYLAEKALGERLYEQFLADCKSLGYPPQHGHFGADMKVESVNDGPVTLILDTEQLMDTPRRK